MIITRHAHARAGLVGNPSDGYFGKTISFIIRNFRTTVQLWESPHFEILPTHGDLARFDSVGAFLKDQRFHGYYGGMRLIKAGIKRFFDYCREHGIELNDRSFTVGYENHIPRLVGLSTNSALVTALIRVLMDFYEVRIPQHELPTLALSVEKQELGLTAGLMDRVIQTYEGIVYMDFDRKLMEQRGYGNYEPMSPQKMPPLYVAYDPERSVVSDDAHRHLQSLFSRNDPTVVGAMPTFAELADRGPSALMAGNWDALGAVMNQNFDVRRTIMAIPPENLRMIEAARATGVSAKFAGSGGAICGLYQDGRQYQQLSDAMAALRCAVIRPMIFEA
jgi:glucuronokinase